MGAAQAWLVGFESQHAAQPRRVRSPRPVDGEAPVRARLPLVDTPSIAMPLSRGQCRGAGICPKLSCRMNTQSEVTDSGTLLIAGGARSVGKGFSFPLRRWAVRRVKWDDLDKAVDVTVRTCDRQPATCALDLAEQEGLLVTKSEDRDDCYHMTPDEIGAALSISRQKADKIIRRAIKRMARKMKLTIEQVVECLKVTAVVSQSDEWRNAPSAIPAPVTKGARRLRVV